LRLGLGRGAGLLGEVAERADFAGGAALVADAVGEVGDAEVAADFLGLFGEGAVEDVVEGVGRVEVVEALAEFGAQGLGVLGGFGLGLDAVFDFADEAGAGGGAALVGRGGGGFERVLGDVAGEEDGAAAAREKRS